MRLAPGPFRRGTAQHRPALSMVALAVVLMWGLVLNGVGAAAPVAAQTNESPVTASVAPADALAYTVVPLDHDSAQWTQALALLERAGLGPAIAAFQEDALGGESDEPLPVELFLGGELAVVVTDAAAELVIRESLSSTSEETFANVTETGFAVALTADSPALIAVAIEGAIAQTAEAVGGEVHQTEHEGVAIEYVEVPGGSDETPLATARVDDFVFVAGFPVDLEPLIETSQGAREALAELDDFNQVRAALDGPHLAFGYVNPFPSDQLRASLAELGLPVGYVEGQSSPSGYLLAADDAGFRLETVALGAAGSEPASAFSAADLLAWTPDDALVFIGGTDLAGTGFLDTLGALLLTLTGLAPPNLDAGSLEEQLEAQFRALALNYGFNPRTEIFQQLTGDYGAWLSRDDGTGAISSLFSAGVAEPETVSAALSQITFIVQSGASGALTIVTRPVGDDSRVYTIETGDATVPRVEYGVVDEQLVVGLGDAVNAVDPGPENPLADDEHFRTIMASLPEPTAGLVYVDLRQAIPLVAAASAETGVVEMADDAGEMTAPGSDAATPVAAGDAHPDCADYETREAAQAAYDAFAPGSFTLDQDFDGQACDDFFGASAPVAATPLPRATPLPELSADAIAVPAASMSAFAGFGTVIYDEDGNSRTSSLLLIVEAEE